MGSDDNDKNFFLVITHPKCDPMVVEPKKVLFFPVYSTNVDDLLESFEKEHGDKTILNLISLQELNGYKEIVSGFKQKLLKGSV